MNSARLPQIVAIGELLWDVFPSGPRFGGAPVNFACHAAALGAEVSLLSGVGSDPLGDRAFQELERHVVQTVGLQRSENYPTGAVQVAVSPAGQPSYQFGEDDAWDHLQWFDHCETLAGNADVICFGSLGQRRPESRKFIERFIKATSQHSWRVFDINVRQPFFHEDVVSPSLGWANVLKLNDEELPILARMFALAGPVEAQLQQLARRFDLSVVAFTRGPQGALLVRDDQVVDVAGVVVEVCDTVGAGDAFTAAMVHGLLAEVDLQAVTSYACEVAAFVCSQVGATPDLPEDLICRIPK